MRYPCAVVSRNAACSAAAAAPPSAPLPLVTGEAVDQYFDEKTGLAVLMPSPRGGGRGAAPPSTTRAPPPSSEQVVDGRPVASRSSGATMTPTGGGVRVVGTVDYV